MGTKEAQREAAKRYLSKLDEIRIRVPRGEKKRIQDHAAKQNESMNAFIVRSINETIQRETNK